MKQENDKNSSWVKYYDIVADELFEKHSLAALILYIQIGEELDFYYNGYLCGISWTKGNEKVILTTHQNNDVQEFPNCKELVMYATIEEKSFIDVWNKIEFC